MSRSRKHGRGSATRGWRKEKPGVHERTVMYTRCGSKCFLGPKTFPICTKKTCTINPRGVHAAYTRARQWKYTRIATRARQLMKTLHV